MELIKVNKDLIEITSSFASEVFIDYYTNINGVEHATYMANKFLSPIAINNLIDEGATFKLMMQNNKPIGFIEYQIIDSRVFLSKLYVRKDLRGNGIGKTMFTDCVAYCKQNKLNKIYLTCNKHNTNSYNIYLHLGFKVIDSVVTDIGNNYVMDDYIMELDINGQ